MVLVFTEWTVPKKCLIEIRVANLTSLRLVSTIQLDLALHVVREVAPPNVSKPVIATTPYLTNKTCTTVHDRLSNLIRRIPLTFLFLLTGASSYSLRKHVQDIQLEIMNNGPVEGALTVYEDFLVYKSGIPRTSQHMESILLTTRKRSACAQVSTSTFTAKLWEVMPFASLVGALKTRLHTG